MYGKRSGGLGARAFVRSRSANSGGTSGFAAGSSGGAADESGSRRLAELLQLRHHMAHLVTNLQIYIQVHGGKAFACMA